MLKRMFFDTKCQSATEGGKAAEIAEEKKKNKLKDSMKKKGGRGPRARSKYTPVVARKQATRSDHFRKKWITAYQAQTSGDSGTATPEQG